MIVKSGRKKEQKWSSTFRMSLACFSVGWSGSILTFSVFSAFSIRSTGCGFFVFGSTMYLNWFELEGKRIKMKEIKRIKDEMLLVDVVYNLSALPVHFVLPLCSSELYLAFKYNRLQACVHIICSKTLQQRE
jgi:hypothetical protein